MSKTSGAARRRERKQSWKRRIEAGEVINEAERAAKLAESRSKAITYRRKTVVSSSDEDESSEDERPSKKKANLHDESSENVAGKEEEAEGEAVRRWLEEAQLGMFADALAGMGVEQVNGEQHPFTASSFYVAYLCWLNPMT